MAEKSISVRKVIFPPEVLLKAAYSFLDTCYIRFDEDADNWIVQISPKKESSVCDNLANEFENELLSQAVRISVYNRTHSIREILLARAMASTMVDEDDPISKIQAEQNNMPDGELEKILTDWFDDK